MIPTRAGEFDRPRDMARRAKKEGAACCGPTKPKRRCRHEAHGRGKPRPYESGDESKEWRREVAATKPKMAPDRAGINSGRRCKTEKDKNSLDFVGNCVHNGQNRPIP